MTQMTTEQVWQRYSAAWSDPDDGSRAATLDACLADGATYCDPNGLIEGREALSAYMAAYQQQTPPGAQFVLLAISWHHDRSLAQWSFVSADREVIYRGASFAALSADGRPRAISGFFDQPGA